MSWRCFAAALTRSGDLRGQKWRKNVQQSPKLPGERSDETQGGSIMEKCKGCKEYKSSAHRRPELGGKVLCSGCYHEAIRRVSPTGLVQQPESLPEWMRGGAG